LLLYGNELSLGHFSSILSPSSLGGRPILATADHLRQEVRSAGARTKNTLSGAEAKSEAARSAKRKKGGEWTPMFWSGMSLPAWLRLASKNRFRVGWRRWHMLLLLPIYTTLHSILRGWQWIVLRFWYLQDATWQVQQRLDSAPLFILGHWRSGTTLLHELMVLDGRHTFPTSYECFEPNHFVISEGIATRLLSFLTPAHRPMDNMAAGWDRPQEDEFALCNLGLPSPYLTMAFPNEPPQDQEYWTLENVPTAARDHWKRIFMRFLYEINARRPKRIVLKSPPHTGRVKILLEMFPKARFIHITRDPCAIFPSTVHLWKRLYETQGLQEAKFAGLENYVFENLTRMYDRFEADRALIPPENFCELRYEDLVADTLGVIQDVYRQLDLGCFSDVREAVEAYVEQNKGYETNKYKQLSLELRQQIATRWRAYADRYGYKIDTSTPDPVKN